MILYNISETQKIYFQLDFDEKQSVILNSGGNEIVLKKKQIEEIKDSLTWVLQEIDKNEQS